MSVYSDPISSTICSARPGALPRAVCAIEKARHMLFHFSEKKFQEVVVRATPVWKGIRIPDPSVHRIVQVHGEMRFTDEHVIPFRSRIKPGIFIFMI